MTITHKGHPLFLWTNSHLTLGCPAGLSSSLMCPPRPPGQQLHHARLDQSSPAPRLVFSRWRSSSAAPLTRRFSTASRPATHPPRRLCRCRHCAPASSVLPATSQLPRRPGQHLPDAAALSSMQGLPWSGNSSAQTSASLHPSRSASLAGPLPFTRGMGAHGLCGRVPDSAGNVSPWIAAAQTDANLSAHLHRLPTPPPYLRRMRLSPGLGASIRWMIRLLPGRGRRCWMSGEVAAWPGAAFLQITARTNPCSRHLWGTLARAVASI